MNRYYDLYKKMQKKLPRNKELQTEDYLRRRWKKRSQIFDAWRGQAFSNQDDFKFAEKKKIHTKSFIKTVKNLKYKKKISPFKAKPFIVGRVKHKIHSPPFLHQPVKLTIPKKQTPIKSFAPRNYKFKAPLGLKIKSTPSKFEKENHMPKNLIPIKGSSFIIKTAILPNVQKKVEQTEFNFEYITIRPRIRKLSDSGTNSCLSQNNQCGSKDINFKSQNPESPIYDRLMVKDCNENMCDNKDNEKTSENKSLDFNAMQKKGEHLHKSFHCTRFNLVNMPSSSDSYLKKQISKNSTLANDSTILSSTTEKNDSIKELDRKKDVNKKSINCKFEFRVEIVTPSKTEQLYLSPAKCTILPSKESDLPIPVIDLTDSPSEITVSQKSTFNRALFNTPIRRSSCRPPKSKFCIKVTSSSQSEKILLRKNLNSESVYAVSTNTSASTKPTIIVNLINDFNKSDELLKTPKSRVSINDDYKSSSILSQSKNDDLVDLSSDEEENSEAILSRVMATYMEGSIMTSSHIEKNKITPPLMKVLNNPIIPMEKSIKKPPSTNKIVRGPISPSDNLPMLTPRSTRAKSLTQNNTFEVISPMRILCLRTRKVMISPSPKKLTPKINSLIQNL